VKVAWCRVHIAEQYVRRCL